jgi:uncharacterized protein (TIGR03118 family)
MFATCISRFQQSPPSSSHITRSSALLGILSVLTGAPVAAQAGVFAVTNLVTDDQTVNTAQITDPALVNAWGISFPPAGTLPLSPFWVSANGSGVATLYDVNPATNATSKLGLTVSIPGDGSVTGQVFNSTAATGSFHGDAFLFVSEDGTISGWRNALGSAAETLQTASTSNVYKGTTEATVGGNTYLYAANFRAGTIDVLKGNAAAPNLTGNFTDPGIPSGYAPFDIRNLDGKLYVTYALQDATKHDDDAGPGRGFVSVFDLQGNFLNRVATMGTLNSPWGLAIAPSSFGAFAGDLLVGNFGDGRINAFNLGTDAFAGQLTGLDGNPVDIDGLWALTPGNGGNAGDTMSIYFSAGPGGEHHGLFGVLTPAPEPASLALLSTALLGMGLARRRKLS